MSLLNTVQPPVGDDYFFLQFGRASLPRRQRGLQVGTRRQPGKINSSFRRAFVVKLSVT
jgi:hypothetical protein